MDIRFFRQMIRDFFGAAGLVGLTVFCFRFSASHAELPQVMGWVALIVSAFLIGLTVHARVVDILIARERRETSAARRAVSAI